MASSSLILSELLLEYLIDVVIRQCPLSHPQHDLHCRFFLRDHVASLAISTVSSHSITNANSDSTLPGGHRSSRATPVPPLCIALSHTGNVSENGNPVAARQGWGHLLRALCVVF